MALADAARLYSARVKDVFNSPESRIFLSLDCLPRIAPTPKGAAAAAADRRASPAAAAAAAADKPAHKELSKEPPPNPFASLLLTFPFLAPAKEEPPPSPDKNAPAPDTDSPAENPHDKSSSTPPPRDNDPKPPTPPPSPEPPLPPKRVVAVSIVGDPNGVPTILHYGLGGGRYLSWIFHEFALRSGLRLIVPDRPDTGLSDSWDRDADPAIGTSPLSASRRLSAPRWRGGFLDWAGVVVQIADKLIGPGAQFAQMGISCGCSYALAVAHRFPERMLPDTPLVLLCSWIPPSVRESPGLVKFARYMPTNLYVSLLETGNWLSADPWNLGWFGDLAATFQWIGDVSAASTGALASAMSLRGELQHAAESSRPSFLYADATTASSSTAASSAKKTPPAAAPSTPPAPPLFRITDAIAKLDAITYISTQNPHLSAREAADLTRNIIHRTPPSATYTPPPPPPGTTWESLRTDPTAPRPDLGTPPGVMPGWMETDVDAEVRCLRVGRGYRVDGAVVDFLNCVEHTGPLGFDYAQTPPGLPIVAVHGDLDPLVPASAIRAVGARCGWDVVVVEGQGHNFVDVDVIMETFNIVAKWRTVHGRGAAVAGGGDEAKGGGASGGEKESAGGDDDGAGRRGVFELDVESTGTAPALPDEESKGGDGPAEPSAPAPAFGGRYRVISPVKDRKRKGDGSGSVSILQLLQE